VFSRRRRVLSLARYLRGFFQKYLTNNFTEETLLFWEFAEDYWRAHPYSPHQLNPTASSRKTSGGTVLSSSARMMQAEEVLGVLREQDSQVLADPAVVRQWAQNIFLTFLHRNAPYLLGCTTARDTARIQERLDAAAQTDSMPLYNLFRTAQVSTFQFMKHHCYPDFVAHPHYHRVLAAAVHAADRVRPCLYLCICISVYLCI
jgi:hypothetical protein